MFQKLKSKITLIASAFVIAGGLPLAIGAAPVHATDLCSSYCYDYCANDGGGDTACLNGWGGGPWVKTYSNPYVQPTSGFMAIGVGGSNVAIEYTPPGGGAWSGKCVGDAYNDSSRADTSLDTCPPGSGAGWGTNFQTYNCSDGNGNYGYDFHNNHWNGYLGPDSYTSNGSPFHLNVWTPTCFFPVEQTH